MFDLQKLMYFEAVARLGSFTKASEELFVSQPTITKAVKALEEEFQTELLMRNKKETSLTPAGQILYKKARYLLDIYDDSKFEIDEKIRNIKNDVTLGLTPVTGTRLMSLILDNHLKSDLKLNVNIVDSGSFDLVKWVEDGTADFAYLIEESIDRERLDNLKITRVLDGKIDVIVSTKNPLSKLSEVDFKDLENYLFFSYPKSTYLEKVIKERAEAENVNFKKYQPMSQIFTLINLVSENLGFTFILDSELPAVRYNKNIKVLHLKEELKFHTCFISNKSRYLKKGAEIFIDYAIKNL
jgi:DNA-binding transcriptional LysR family regulator